MPKFGPIKRRDLIRCLRQLGFDGPEPGTRHQIMVKGSTKESIHNNMNKSTRLWLCSERL